MLKKLDSRRKLVITQSQKKPRSSLRQCVWDCMAQHGSGDRRQRTGRRISMSAFFPVPRPRRHTDSYASGVHCPAVSFHAHAQISTDSVFWLLSQGSESHTTGLAGNNNNNNAIFRGEWRLFFDKR